MHRRLASRGSALVAMRPPASSLGPLAALLMLLCLACRASGPAYPMVADDPRVPPNTAKAPVPSSEPPPISLTASDGTGLALASVKADAMIEDPLALTQLELAFDNPRDVLIEGRFEILLPPGARVTRFAMEIGGQWQEAEVVEKQQARRAYETFLHQQRDPALLERDTGNRFRARVFPIQPRERKRLVVSYIQEYEDLDEPYRFSARGLPWLEELDLKVRIAQPEDGSLRLEHRRVAEAVPEHDLVVPRRAETSAGLRHGERVVARIEPLAGAETREAPPLRHLTVLFDTSASRALDFHATVDGLGRLLQTLARQAGAAKLEVLAFDQEVVSIYEGPLAGFGTTALDTLRSRRPLGASDLHAALAALEGRDRQRILLVSDGLVSAGSDSPAELRRQLLALDQTGAERLDALVVGGVRDDARLQSLVRGALPRSGVVLEPTEDLDHSVARLLHDTVDGLKVDVPGARWWSPTHLDGVQPGDQVLVYAELPEDHEMSVQLAGAVHRELPVALREVDSPLVERGWMHARVEGFVRTLATLEDELQSAALRDRVVALSVEHRIFNDYTAFLVLETEADYARFGLDRKGLRDIMVVGDAGVRLEQRSMPTSILAEPRPEPPRTGAGTISGVVTHQQTHERLPDALVILQCSCLGGSRETMTNDNGLYAFRDLPPGTYTIQVLSGQADVSKVATLPRGAKFRANFTLDPANEFRRLIRVEAQPVEQSASVSSRDATVHRRSQRQQVGMGQPPASPLEAIDDAADDMGAGRTVGNARRRRRDREAARASAGPPVERSVGIEDEPPAPPIEPVMVQEFVETTEVSETSVGRTVSMEEFRNIPVGNSSSRDFTQVVESSATASVDSAGISLAGTTGAESYYMVEGMSISDPSFGGSSTPHYAKVSLRNTRLDRGGLSRIRVQRRARAQLDGVEQCYWQGLIAQHRLRGRIDVVLYVDADGGVSAVRQRDITGLSDPELLRCIESRLLQWQLPAPGQPVEVSQTLVFHPRDGVPPSAHYYEDGVPEQLPSDTIHAWSGTFAEVQDALIRRRNDDAWEQAVAWREAAPADVLAVVALGDAAKARGQLDLAARAYGSVFDLYPSRADMRRFAAGRLETLRHAPALALAVDAYRKAVAQRPDHPSSHRNLAFALLQQGEHAEAFEVLAKGLQRRYPAGRFAEVQTILREDLGIVAAAWIRQAPAEAHSIRGRLATLGAAVASAPSLRFVLTWETDANDVDLHVYDGKGAHAYYEQPQLRSGGRLYADVTNGFGPECLSVPEPGDAYPYRLAVHYYARGPMGYGMGKVQVLHHDGEGQVWVEDRSFVAMRDGAYLDLGLVSPERMQVAQTAEKPGKGPR